MKIKPEPYIDDGKFHLEQTFSISNILISEHIFAHK